MLAFTPRAIAALLAIGVAAPFAAHADSGRLEAHYIASIAGIPIGKGTWTINITEGQYAAAASGMTTGLMRVFAGGEGTSMSRGVFASGKLMLVDYTATVKMKDKTDEVRFLLNAGTVKNLSVEPPVTPDHDRIPVTEAEKHGVIDPMTASLVRVNGEATSPEGCQRTVAVFDGRMRYDLRLAYKRVDHVKAEKGYQGPVLVCSVFFSPIAGHIPTRAAIKYLAEQHDMEVWLAPITGTHVLVPYRMQAPTPIGPAVLEATHFVTMAQPARPTSASAKTQ
ncbi:MAG TPA: DUF3108 domain-containing protein [Pseudolabrys sp.]|nr:DUF3108 domain-containing protein [Pseudolabrys sp.]